MEAPESNQTSSRDFLHVVFKRKKQIVFFFIVTVIAVCAVTLAMSPIYEANTQVLVKTGRENLYVPTVPASGTQSPVINVDREEQLNTEVEILTRQNLLEEVVAALGAQRIYEDLREEKPGLLKRVAAGRKREPISAIQKAALRLKKNLVIQPVRKSNVIDIRLRHENPTIAALVLNKLIDLYMDLHLEAFKSPRSSTFFQQQSGVLRTRLQEAEEALEAFKKKHSVSSLDEERSLVLEHEGALHSEYNRTLSAISETENRIRQIRRQLSATPQRVPQDKEIEHSPYIINTLQARLVELELKEKELLVKYTLKSRFVQNVKDEIRIVRDKLTEQEVKQYGKSTSGLNTTYQLLQESLYENQAELTAMKAKMAVQAGQLSEYGQELDKLSRIEVDLKVLQRQVDVDQQNYRLYLSKFEESRISAAMDTEKIMNVNQIQPAKPPVKPVSPKVLLNLALAFFLGISGGLGLALFREYLDDSLERPEEAEDCLHLPVLASIPELRG